MAAFPNLPEYSITTTESLNEIKTMDSENWGTEENITCDELNIEALEALNKQVRNHKVPAITFIISSTIICYLSLVVIPLAALMIYFSFFKTEMKEPIIITEGIAKTSVTLAVLSGYAGRIFFRRLDDPHNTGHPIMDPLDFDYKFNFTAFGGNSKDIDILKYCTTQIPVSNAAISQIRKFKPNNPYMNQIRNFLFTNSINFTLYFNQTDYVKRLSSVTEITYMVSNHIGKFYDWGTAEGQMWTVENVLSSDSLTARHNTDGSLRAMGKSLDLMYVYYGNFKDTYILTFKITIVVLSAICIIVYITIYFVQLKKLRKNRYEILYILTTLPKTMISNISSSFSKVNNAGDSVKTETDADVNRQEESIVKLFGSITDGAGASSEMGALMVFSLMIIICCVSYYTILSDYIDLTEKVVGKSSHIYHLYGCAAYLYSVMGAIFKIVLCTYDKIFENAVVNLTAEIGKYQERISLVIDHFNALDLGSPEQGPFDGLEEIIDYATKAIYCYSKEIPPANFLRSVHCFSAPQQFELVIALLKKFGSEMTEKTPIYPDPSEKTLSQLWQVGPVELYEVFFFKAGNEIVPLLSQRIDDMHKKIILSGILYMCAELLLTGVVLMAAKQENDFLKFSLKAFLRCPPIAIFSNHRVMNLLCGTYSTRIDDMGERHATYYEEVVNKLDDIVIVASDETRKIYNVNSAFVNMFGIEKNEIENYPFDEFLARVSFESDEEISKVFSSLTNVRYRNAKGEIVYLEFSSVSVSGRRIIYATNQTQNVLHEKLIAEEKQKSDRMLSSILPPSMVPRVQAGEKNISFAVQSVSVLFLDIVSFTPWCGSHDAQYVMRMLNLMFKRLDALTAMHKTMTKIKCIGDCYMAAGGIFDEVNQPAVHAKEVVDFGRGAIQTILEIDERENEKLQIRVGVNTGGPIVTGVIGTEKPTFEILGPAINIAHEMEHHGVPMKVHISRPVYELIYGQQFEIKERGEIDVKGSKMFTYLVEP